MGRKKEWANNAMRRQAFDIRAQHPDWSNAQIKDQIVANLKPKPLPMSAHETLQIMNKINADVLQHHNTSSASNDETTQKYPLPEDLQKVVRYTAQCQAICETWRPSDTIAYLEKSKQINTLQQVTETSLKSKTTTELLALMRLKKSLPTASSLLTSSEKPSDVSIPANNGN